MIHAKKTKLFFIVLFAVLLIINLMTLQMDKLQFESSRLSNFLISKNAIKCIVGNQTPLTKEELEEVMEKYPNAAIMTCQNRASFRCLGFYSKNVNYFNKYLIQGRFFHPDEINEESNKIVAGKNILNSSIRSVHITQEGATTYAEIDKVTYEVIGVIGGELSSSLDNLVIFSSPILNHYIYYLDSERSSTKQKAFNYLQEKYSAEKMEKQSSLMDSVIKTDIQFEILSWIQVSIKILLIIVLIYLSYKMNNSMVAAQYLMGLPLSFAVKESSKNILPASLPALVVVVLVMGARKNSLKDVWDIVYGYTTVTGSLLLIQAIICVTIYCRRTFNRILPDDQGDKHDNA